MKENYSYFTTLHKFTKNHDHGLYCSSDMVWDGCNGYFSFYPPNSPKKFHFKKSQKKKIPGDIIIEHKCTQNHDHMLYCFWMWHVTDVFVFVIFHFGKCFALFTPLAAQKMKIFLKRKKCLDTSSFNKSVPEIIIICFTVPEIWYMTDLIVIFHFVLLFALLPLAFFILNTILSFLSTSATK